MKALLFYLLAVALLLSHQYPFSWDSAEFYTDAANGWFTHPPGAPVFMAIARVVPLDFLPVLSSWAVLLLTYLIGKRLFETSIPIYLLATAPIFLLNFNWAEIYMPCLALLMAAVYFYLPCKCCGKHDVLALMLSAILFGLSIGIYPSAVLFTVFFLIYPLMSMKDRTFNLALAMMHIILSASIAFICYYPIMHELGGVAEGFGWITGIAGEVSHEAVNASPMVVLKRLLIAVVLYGVVAPLAAAYGAFKKENLPFTLTIAAFGFFLLASTMHFYEHLLLPIPLIALLAGASLKNARPIFQFTQHKMLLKRNILYYVLLLWDNMPKIILFAAGLSTAYLLGDVYHQKDAFLSHQIGMVEYLPSYATVIELANFEHLYYMTGEFHKIFALGGTDELDTSHEIFGKKPQGTTGRLWTQDYSTIGEQLKESKAEGVYVFNTAFLQEGQEEKLRDLYNLTQVMESPELEFDSPIWGFVTKPASMRFDRIILYRIRPYPYVFVYKNQCVFTVPEYFYRDIAMTKWSGVACPYGMEAAGVKYCFKKCITPEQEKLPLEELPVQCQQQEFNLLCKVGT